MLTGDVRIVKSRFRLPNFAPLRLGGRKSESEKENSPAKHALSNVEGAQRRQDAKVRINKKGRGMPRPF